MKNNKPIYLKKEKTPLLPVGYIHMDLNIATRAKTELTITWEFDRNLVIIYII